jgi:hypothetical protein
MTYHWKGGKRRRREEDKRWWQEEMAGILWNSVGAEFYEGDQQLAGVHAPSTVGELEPIVPRATAEKTTWALSA